MKKKNKKKVNKWVLVLIVVAILLAIGAYCLLASNGNGLPRPPTLPR